MKPNLLKPLVLAAVLLVSACSTTPSTTPLLDQARSDYVAANNNPDVTKYAQAEFRQATEALDKANAAASKREAPEDIDKLAYLAKQRVATAQEVAKQKAAEARVAEGEKLRTQIQLDARAAEADKARQQAAAAQAQAQSAQQQAAAAQQQAAAADARTREAEARAAQLQLIMVELQAKQSPRGLIVTIGDVLFQVNSATLNQNGLANLRKLADALVQNPNRTVLVEGFADSTGSSDYNQQLSERRATAVRNALTEMGVPRERVAMRAYGEAFPVAPNDTANNRALNRRVEIVLSNENATIPPR